ncbi:Rossmann fold nucleotide-binding protein Smf [Sandaracinus amylolyticus]|nr:Rossmann fold nucleotide-binding protein Smf [Sandaracinus amylolyticus]
MRTHDLSHHAFDFLPSDPAWPACLEELPDPPAKLRVAGELPFLDRAVAIVGTRRASDDALEIARRMARDLAAAGFVVVSGGAEGIDAAAHHGALEGDGRSIAVLASGLSRPYPRGHASLFERIAASGAVITEAAHEDEPRAHTFLSRNRLIAALSRAVIVVQAPARSGALSTAGHARISGRPLFAVPWAVDDVRGEGGVALLARSHARACRNADDVIEAITGERVTRPRRAARAPRTRLDDDQKVVIEALRSRPSHVDDLVRTTGLPASRVQTTLTTLMLLGLAAPDERGAFRRMR